MEAKSLVDGAVEVLGVTNVFIRPVASHQGLDFSSDLLDVLGLLR